MTQATDNVVWAEERWHCAGKPIHAGTRMQLRASHTGSYTNDGEYMEGPPGDWVDVRIESREQGRVLLAYSQVSELVFSLRVGPGHELRWPKEDENAR